MSGAERPAGLNLGIASVERETGLSKDALRVWERRYGFPQPGRDETGERTYPLEQVEKLRLIKRLLDRGYRPGKIIHLDADELRALNGRAGTAAEEATHAEEGREDLARFLELCKRHQFDELRSRLSQLLLRQGMYGFVLDVVAPLTSLVGERWSAGELAVFEEHLYTELVQGVLRNAIAAIPSPPGATRPRILLTTFPQEQHGLGLLMAEAIFAMEGAYCISLGVQTPILDIAQAAQTQEADIIALSFSASMNAAQALDGLRELRVQAPRTVEIWAGGQCAALYRRPPPEVQVLDLHEIKDMLARWRGRHPD